MVAVQNCLHNKLYEFKFRHIFQVIVGKDSLNFLPMFWLSVASAVQPTGGTMDTFVLCHGMERVFHVTWAKFGKNNFFAALFQTVLWSLAVLWCNMSRHKVLVSDQAPSLTYSFKAKPVFCLSTKMVFSLENSAKFFGPLLY